jgi:hypothetical protein
MGLGALHVTLDLFHAAQLIRSLTIKKGLLKLDLPFGVRRMRKTVTVWRSALTLSIFAANSSTLFSALLRSLLPGGTAELAKGWGTSTDTDIASDHVRLHDGYKELGLVSIMQDKHFLLFTTRRSACLNASKAGDAVIIMNDEIAIS